MTDKLEEFEIEKKESNPTPSDKRLRLSEIGKPYIKTLGGLIKEEARKELAFPKCLETYDLMREDATVDAGLTVNEVFLTKALMGMKFKVGKNKSKSSQDFTNYLNWNFKNLEGQTWYEVITSLITYQQYGFSWLEKVYSKNSNKEYSSYKYKIKKLATRAQKSVARWEFDEKNRNLTGLWQYQQQNLDSLYTNFSNFSSRDSLNDLIPRYKFMLFSWDNKNNNPQGRSLLNGCYRALKEKSMIASYEVVGVSKDMGGLLVLRVPTDIINKAAEDPSSDEAKSLKTLQTNAANVHAGDQTYILLGSDTLDGTGSGKFAYDIELKGIDGSGKQYKTSELINERKKAILDSLGAGFLNLGNDGVGSYALSTGKQSLHAFYMERHLMFIKSVFENDLVPQLAEINGVKLTEDEMPTMVFGDIDEPDQDVLSKVGQRVGSVGLFPKQKDILLDYWEKLGLDITSLRDLSQEEIDKILTPDDNRAGESGGSSGVGNSQSGGAASSLNSENKSLHKLPTESFVEVEINGRKVIMLKEDAEILDAL